MPSNSSCNSVSFLFGIFLPISFRVAQSFACVCRTHRTSEASNKKKENEKNEKWTCQMNNNKTNLGILSYESHDVRQLYDENLLVLVMLHRKLSIWILIKFRVVVPINRKMREYSLASKRRASMGERGTKRESVYRLCLCVCYFSSAAFSRTFVPTDTRTLTNRWLLFDT